MRTQAPGPKEKLAVWKFSDYVQDLGCVMMPPEELEVFYTEKECEALALLPTATKGNCNAE